MCDVCGVYSQQVQGASWPPLLLSSSWFQLWPVCLPLWSGHEGLRLGVPSLASLCSAPPRQRYREHVRRWVNVTVWVCWSTSAVTQHIRGSGGERQAYTEDDGALWREAGWQERPFSQLFSFNFERTPFFNRSLASQRQRRQLVLQQLISVKDGWMKGSERDGLGFFFLSMPT